MPKSRKTTPAKAAGRPARKTARKSAKPTRPQRPVAKAASSRAPKMRSPTTSARRSKKAAIISLLQRPDGAALGDLTAATGWQVHSVRAALTGLRKRGLRRPARSGVAVKVLHNRDLLRLFRNPGVLLAKAMLGRLVPD